MSGARVADDPVELHRRIWRGEPSDGSYCLCGAVPYGWVHKPHHGSDRPEILLGHLDGAPPEVIAAVARGELGYRGG